MACFTALASQSLPCQSTFHIDYRHSALYTVHICWCSYLDWNFTISTHQHKEVSSRSALTILFSFVFSTRPGLHCVSATHMHTDLLIFIYLNIFIHLGQSVHPICFIGWRFKLPLMPSLRAIYPPCIWHHSVLLRSPTQHLPHLITFVYLVVLPLHQMELQEDWYFLVKFFIIYMLFPCWSKYSRLQFQTVWKIMNVGGEGEPHITI